nr:secreted seminal-vesicle Ly-6 protein 1-like [Pogona vitticeps]
MPLMDHTLLFAICVFHALVFGAHALQCRKCFEKGETLGGICKPFDRKDVCEATKTETCGLDKFYVDGELKAIVRTCVERIFCGKRAKFFNNNHFYEDFTCCNDQDLCNEYL